MNHYFMRASCPSVELLKGAGLETDVKTKQHFISRLTISFILLVGS